MAYKAYVVKVENLRPHTNADRLQIATFFGNDTIVGLDVVRGEIGVYFPTDGQLSEEFCQVHDLVRRKDENGNPAGGYLDPDKRNVKAVRLRGEKSDGLFMPISCLVYTGVNLDDINIGDTIDVVNGHEICKKYIPRSNHRTSYYTEDNRTRKAKKIDVAPLFVEHADTEQLAYNLGAFKSGDEIEITLKMHGTSQRTAHLPVLKGYKDSLFRRIVNKAIMGLKARKNWGEYGRKVLYHSLKHGEPIYGYGYVTGTRRTVLENYDGGYYGSNEFREQHSKFFEGKLWKGEEVYYEVVGFTHTGAPIMSTANNSKLQDKEFIKQYGKETVFSYGCSPQETVISTIDDTSPIIPQSDIYIYRMTMTNEDGDIVEYTPDFMRYRCEQMGVKTVPIMWKGTIPEVIDYVALTERGEETGELVPVAVDAGQWIKEKAECFYDGPDPIGKTHVREGVVVRILNRPKFAAYKHKNFAFKCLEGIVKAEAEAPDMEEAQEVENVSQEVENV